MSENMSTDLSDILCRNNPDFDYKNNLKLFAKTTTIN